MAANYFNSIHHHHNHHRLRRRHSIDCPPTTATNSSFFSLKPARKSNNSLSRSILTTFSLSSTSSSSASTSISSTSQQPAINFDLLQQHLSAQNFREADEETRRLLIVLAGEAAQKRGYVFFSEVQFISETDLRTIDELWRKYSDNKFGYSVQKKAWNKVNKNFSNFFIKVGWMKKLDTEVEQYNYRSFPTEFMWENSEETPQGHLPLTNALRGTQLLNAILSHPAFEGGNDDEEDQIGIVGSDNGGLKSSRNNGKLPLNKRVFKTDYTF
ncbi:OLC1v1018667C1 [Oldenlandia corymbosa var. corymbosa]|uniref:OLC1v1018667C1 n=1 Tax=Oldenlandia corymbosa var. corymbosa TaxID=529605 RepID=A0AAV1ECG8_OLDCO|nr:OLC1v1018667C1 [Oldenlandia corymbosa var. corymbosa]